MTEAVMRIRVLGSAAGGGAPQWNCNAEVSRRLRAGAAPFRTQSSLAVSADGESWFLLNASPDLGEQLRAASVLHPQGRKTRHSPLKGVVLTNGDIDHVAGLLTLRESQPLALYATARVLGSLAGNVIFNVLNERHVERRAVALDAPFPLRDRFGAPSGLTVEAFAVPGKVALWLEDEAAGADFGSKEEDTIALTLRAGGASFHYVPACASMTPSLAARLKGARLVFFDGTLWRDDEMRLCGAGEKTGARMGHMSMSGAQGSLAAFSGLDVRRKVFIHINTTNPALLPDSPERGEVESRGWEVAYDGWETTLAAAGEGRAAVGEGEAPVALVAGRRP